jgi:hypothetical protein
MIHYIKEIIEVNNFSIVCTFNTNEIRSIDLEQLVKKYSSNADNYLSKLGNVDYFKAVKLDSYGTLSWNNEIDFCPDVLYQMSKLVNDLKN